MIDVLFLDLGGVMVDVDKHAARTRWEQLTGGGSHDFDACFFAEALVERMNEGLVSAHEFAHEVSTRAAARGITIDEPAVLDVWSAVIRFRPEAERLVGEARRHLGTVWVISDTCPTHEALILDHLTAPVPPLVDGATTSWRVLASKPSPRIYRRALEAVGAPAEACFFLDDRAGNVEGARAMGMASEQVDDVESLARALVRHGILDERSTRP